MSKEACVAAACFGALFTLAVLSPWKIGQPADPLQTPPGIKPEWYFLPTYQLLKYFTGASGKVLGIMVSGIPFLLLFLWPFIERGPGRRPSRRKWAVGLGCLAVVVAIFLGILGHISETTMTVGGRTYEIDMYGVPHRIEGADLPTSRSSTGE
jgi:quinol-cytochrome oxidoreductase complex cytochrome b subunit